MKACEENADAQRVADYNAGTLAGVSPVQLCTDGPGGECFSSSGLKDVSETTVFRMV